MKYKYGVEYPTNGKKPDLPDDVVIECFDGVEWWGIDGLKVEDLEFNTAVTQKFRIVDQRYKPKEPESKTVKCACIGCENKATHTWSGHPTCDSCGSPSRLGSKPKQPEQQTEPDNSWFERGELPPVGVECEWTDGGKHKNTKVKILAYCGDFAWIKPEKDFPVTVLNPAGFRPIKSEREKFIEKLSEVLHSTENGVINDISLGQAYDAGFRAPE